MEVTRKNFSETCPQIMELLKTCDFYSFDVEMTGINPVRLGQALETEIRTDALPHGCRFYSTPEESFSGKWEAAKMFSPMQFGLSIFHKDGAPKEAAPSASAAPAAAGAAAAKGVADRYTSSTFSWHLFPSWHYGDSEIRLSSETIGDFLAKGGMDFNAWVRKGLLYAPREAVARAAEAEAAKLAKLPSEDRKLATKALSELTKFAANNAHNPKAATPRNTLPFLGGDAFPLVMGKARSLGLQVAGGAISWENGVVSDPSLKHQANILFEAMINSKKPAVGHNSWSDLVFLYRAFHEVPLRSYAHFKEAMRTLFPILYDTRTLSSLDSSYNFGQVRGQLEKTYDSFKVAHENNSVVITREDAFSEGSGAAHNAGYDAYITGSLFLYVTAEMKKYDGLSAEMFNGVLPVYASIFSVSLHTEHDYLVQSRQAPIYVATPGQKRGGFADNVASIFARQGLRGIPMNCGDCVLLYVIGGARSLDKVGASEAAAVSEVRGVHQGATVINMKVDEFLEGTNGKIQFFSLPPSLSNVAA